jgi:hypothetical protein
MDKAGIITRARVMLDSFVLQPVMSLPDYATGSELIVAIFILSRFP